MPGRVAPVVRLDSVGLAQGGSNETILDLSAVLRQVARGSRLKFRGLILKNVAVFMQFRFVQGRTSPVGLRIFLSANERGIRKRMKEKRLASHQNTKQRFRELSIQVP